eukprot:scaffold11986_cov127-Isochrysis_galbana.AAC.1
MQYGLQRRSLSPEPMAFARCTCTVSTRPDIQLRRPARSRLTTRCFSRSAKARTTVKVRVHMKKIKTST